MIRFCFAKQCLEITLKNKTKEFIVQIALKFWKFNTKRRVLILNFIFQFNEYFKFVISQSENVVFIC